MIWFFLISYCKELKKKEDKQFSVSTEFPLWTLAPSSAHTEQAAALTTETSVSRRFISGKQTFQQVLFFCVINTKTLGLNQKKQQSVHLTVIAFFLLHEMLISGSKQHKVH